MHLQRAEGSLRLHLPALRSATITAAPLWRCGHLNVDGDSFRHASGLELLWFRHTASVRFLPDCFLGLPALATVELYSCDVWRIPEALTGLRCSLTHLELPCNDALQLWDEGISTLLALSKLRTLNLRKPPSRSLDSWSTGGTDSSKWLPDSLQHLMDLPSAFLNRHGHELNLQVEDDECWEAQEDERCSIYISTKKYNF